MVNTEMGKQIAALRKEKGMTQQELAAELNITDKAVSKWERGLSCPDIAILPRLGELLGVDANSLLEGRREKAGEKTKVKEILPLVCKAVGLALGVGCLTASILGAIEAEDSIRLLSLGVIAFGIALLSEHKK